MLGWFWKRNFKTTCYSLFGKKVVGSIEYIKFSLMVVFRLSDFVFAVVLLSRNNNICYWLTDFLVSAAVAEFKGPHIFGVVRLAQVNMELARIEANFSGLPAGKYGWSINQFGDLTRGAASTGKVFNPSNEANEVIILYLMLHFSLLYSLNLFIV